MPYYRLSSTGMSVWFLPQPQVQAGNVFALNQRVSGTKKKIKLKQPLELTKPL